MGSVRGTERGQQTGQWYQVQRLTRSRARGAPSLPNTNEVRRTLSVDDDAVCVCVAAGRHDVRRTECDFTNSVKCYVEDVEGLLRIGEGRAEDFEWGIVVW